MRDTGPRYYPAAAGAVSHNRMAVCVAVPLADLSLKDDIQMGSRLRYERKEPVENRVLFSFCDFGALRNFAVILIIMKGCGHVWNRSRRGISG